MSVLDEVSCPATLALTDGRMNLREALAGRSRSSVTTSYSSMRHRLCAGTAS
ncbi:hypothetical protein BSFP_049240 [Burkholderia stabilis]|uniref:Uncharacterized protein n=1 Tax=Burkholderia stabilis TaxID=95485 RepID=A0A1Y1BX98_9BURK|nr:hypothetical protein BSFP_049240 [Burkholderia stabilis]